MVMVLVVVRARIPLLLSSSCYNPSLVCSLSTRYDAIALVKTEVRDVLRCGAVLCAFFCSRPSSPMQSLWSLSGFQCRYRRQLWSCSNSSAEARGEVSDVQMSSREGWRSQERHQIGRS